MYVRKDGYWPGEAGWWSNHTDAEMTQAWHENRVALMVMTGTDSPTPDWPNQPIEPGVNGIWFVYTRGRTHGFVLDSCAVFLDELGPTGSPPAQQPDGWRVGFVAWGQPLAEIYPDDEPKF